MSERTPSNRGHRLLAMIVVALALAIGWLGTRFSTAIDLTANARHSLSESSLQVAAALDGPLNLIAVMRTDPAQVDALSALVDRFRAVKQDITLDIVNPDTDPARARELATSPGGALILRLGDREQRLQKLSERTLVGAMRRLAREDDRDIVFITGHAERSPTAQTDDDWSELAGRLASSGLASREVSLVAEPYLDDSIDVVVIAAPRLPYFPGEIASLLDFVNRGGNLLWLAETPGQAEAGRTDIGPGLDQLSTNFGVDVLPGRVIDTASQALDADTPDFVLLDSFPVHPVTATLVSPVLLPQARALAVTPLAGQETLPLLATPESSWTETGPLEGEVSPDEDEGEVTGPLLLGITIEREHGDRSLQRIAVVGDADFAASRFLGNGSNAVFAESLLLWLAGDGTEGAFLIRDTQDGELALGNTARIALLVTFLIGVPLILLIVAGWLWRRRR